MRDKDSNQELNIEDIRAAAEQGDAEAQFNLGWCYWCNYINNGAAQDRLEASKWYRRAAEQGLDKAQEVLDLFEARRMQFPERGPAAGGESGFPKLKSNRRKLTVFAVLAILCFLVGYVLFCISADVRWFRRGPVRVSADTPLQDVNDFAIFADEWLEIDPDANNAGEQ